MLHFRLGATAGPLGDEGALCCCIDCRGLELAGGSQTHGQGRWGWYSRAGWPRQCECPSSHKVITVCKGRCKRWCPERQFTFRKFSAMEHFLFNESLLLHSEWFMKGFKNILLWLCLYTLNTLHKIRNLWNKLVNIQNIMLSEGCVMSLSLVSYRKIFTQCRHCYLNS